VWPWPELPYCSLSEEPAKSARTFADQLPDGPVAETSCSKVPPVSAEKRGIVTSSPLASGLAIAIGTVVGFVVLGNSSIEVGLLGAISAFAVMVVLRSYFG
jgi:hypothetical protein